MGELTKPIVLAVTSDTHAGSTVGLCPPEKIGLDDGGYFQPSQEQKWIWSCWEDYWATVRTLRESIGAELYVVLNGDLFEGDHHRSTQIVSPNPEPQAYIAERAFGKLSPIAESRPDYLFIVRGTEAHVGPSGATEEAFARSIAAVPDTSRSGRPIWSWWHLRLLLNGKLFDFQHHGRMGSRPWTESNAINALAAEIFYHHVKRGERYPDVAFRSHRHRWGDSYKAHPVRVIQTPAWQLKTSYAHKVVPEPLSDIGGIIATVCADGTIGIEEKIYPAALSEPWTAPQTTNS